MTFLSTRTLGVSSRRLPTAHWSSQMLISKKHFGNEFSGWLDSGLMAVRAKILIFTVGGGTPGG